jgi:hypothetical protein
MFSPYLLHRTVSSNIKAPPVVPEMNRQIRILAEFLEANQDQRNLPFLGGDRDRAKKKRRKGGGLVLGWVAKEERHRNFASRGEKGGGGGVSPVVGGRQVQAPTLVPLRVLSARS